MKTQRRMVQTFPTRVRCLGGLLALLAAPGAVAHSAPAAKPGAPARLVVYPPEVVLAGKGTTQRLIAVATYADGSQRDVTSAVAWKTGNAAVVKVAGASVTSTGDGETGVVATLGGKSASLKAVAQDTAIPHRWSFANEIVPVLTKTGCNSGGCHGSPSGRGGFKLSLFGFEPDYDYEMVTKDAGGKRVNRGTPLASLFYQKPTGKSPHGGGLRFGEQSAYGRRLAAWLAAGAPKQPEFDPRLRKIEIYPSQWVLPAKGDSQRLLVVARRDDNTTQDVTDFARYLVNDDQVAAVDDEGQMSAAGMGDTTVIVRYLGAVGVVPVRVPRPPLPASAFSTFKPANALDEAVLARLKDARVPPSDLASDAEFLRRATLDACGVLPTPEEVKAFLADSGAEKRTKLVDRLLARPEYVDFWTLKWADLFRNSSRALQAKGMHAYSRWIRESVLQNKPWDQMARELITASGSAHRYGPSNWYVTATTAEDRASAASQVFLGLRIDCARCHNHPFEAWSQNDYYGFAAFFARVRFKQGLGDQERLVYAALDGELQHPRDKKPVPPRVLGGEAEKFAPGEDRRDRLAAWMTAPQNPFFARAIGNRLWNHFFGRGVVQPVDDVRVTNPASNEALMAALGREVVRQKFNLKAVCRGIMLSRTYQASSRASERNRDDRQLFSHALPRRLPAEVLLDAINSATGTTDKFGPYPLGTRAVQVPDNRVNNPFLDLFGRPQREVACECERPEEANLSMALDLINGSTVNTKVAHPQGRVARLFAAKAADRDMVADLYLAALSRPPSEKEAAAAEKLFGSAPSKKEGAEDLLWALINTKEFVFNH